MMLDDLSDLILLGGAGGISPLLAAIFDQGDVQMARYEHLPIYKKAQLFWSKGNQKVQNEKCKVQNAKWKDG